MPEDFYETDRAVAEYLVFHYGAPEHVLPYAFGPVEALHFPVRCVTECLELKRLPGRPRALDLGCAVGRSSFELARHCVEVIGIDHSARFIEAATRLQERGLLPFRYLEEGELWCEATAAVPANIERRRVRFERGDATDLRDHLGAFDVVLMANLIDRLRDPASCLRRVPGLVNPGGQLVLTSPYTWLEDYTPRANWLGGFEREGRPVRPIDALKAILSPDFELAGRKDLPFLIREHARKFQWSVAEASVWVRR